MSGHDYTGTYSAGITLTNTASSPVTIGAGALVTNGTGVALQSTLEAYLAIGNYGSIGGYTAGVSLASAGTVVNHASISSSQASTTNSGYGYVSSIHAFIPLSGGVITFGGGVSNAASASIISYVEAIAIGNDGSGPARVDNAGTIVASSTRYGFGIVLAAGGTVSNAATGTISAGRYGVLVTGTGAAAVTNLGVIASQGRAAIDIFPGGFISNAAGATIAGAVDGIISGGTLGSTVDNSGIVIGAATIGINLVNGGFISNAFGATIGGGHYGIIAGGPAGLAGSTVNNAGSIFGTGVVGVFLPAGGSVSNAATGTITGGFAGVIAYGTVASSVTNNGGISGHYFGAKLTEPNGSFLNTGSIASSATFNGSGGFDAAGVALTGGGVVTNASGGSIRATWKGVEVGTVSASIGGTVINQGFIYASNYGGSTGAAVWVHGPASITNAASGTIAGGPFGIVLYNQATVINHGSIFGTEFAVFQSNTSYSVHVTDYPGASFTGLVEGATPTGTSSGVLELASAATTGTISNFRADRTIGSHYYGYIGFGEVLIDSGATWSLGGTVAASQTLDFGGTHASLTLGNPRAMTGTITSFVPTDTLVLGGITDATSATLTAGNTLVVSESVGPGLTLHFDPSQDFSGEAFNLLPSDTGTSLFIPCFAAGTRIATPRGPVVVEHLHEGDEVLTVTGAIRTIKWIGHRRVDCRRHPAPDRVCPVRIAAHAFGQDRPQHPLLLSPDHSVFVEGVLIPVKFLINNITIEQVERDHIDYYHLELASHDVVFAEGLPTETYLETGGRAAFEDADVTQLHPDFTPHDSIVAAIWDARGYAPLLGSNGEFERARRMLACQADMLATPRTQRRRRGTSTAS